MNFEKVKDQFGSWALPLKPFIESHQMDDIFAFLRSRGQAGNVICPHHTDVFRAFRECDYNSLRCVIVGQDPYPWIRDGSYAADGLAFSSAHTGELEPSLKGFYEGMEEDLGNGMDLSMDRNPDLSYLAKQGVLLLNAALTTEKDVIGAHAPIVLPVGEKMAQVYIWDPFMRFIFNEVLNLYDRTIFVFMGKGAQRYSKEPIPFHHHVFEVEHPAAAAYNGGKWKHDHIFSRVNNVLRMSNGRDYEIKWYEQRH